MAQQLKAKTSSLLSILQATKQNEIKGNVAITNHMPYMIDYLIEVSKNETLKAPQRMAAVKMLGEWKKDFDKELFAKVEELQKEAEEQAQKAVEEELDRVPVKTCTPEEREAAFAQAKKMLAEIEL